MSGVLNSGTVRGKESGMRIGEQCVDRTEWCGGTKYRWGTEEQCENERNLISLLFTDRLLKSESVAFSNNFREFRG